MPLKKWTDKDILRIKALYLHSRFVLNFDKNASKAVVGSYTKTTLPAMSKASLAMYCDDAEEIETLLTKKRFDKGKTSQALSFIKQL